MTLRKCSVIVIPVAASKRTSWSADHLWPLYVLISFCIHIGLIWKAWDFYWIDRCAGKNKEKKKTDGSQVQNCYINSIVLFRSTVHTAQCKLHAQLSMCICRKYYIPCSFSVQSAINPKLYNMKKYTLETMTSLPKPVFFQSLGLQNGDMFLISHVMTRLRMQALIFT